MDRRQFGPRGVLPHEESAPERIRVVAQPATGRQLLEYLSVAAAEHNIVGLERGDQSVNHVKNVLPPLFLASLLQSALADIVLISGLLVRQMTKLHRLHDSVDDERRAEAGSQPNEQHLALFIAAERLHGCVIDHFDRPAERLLEVEAHPAGPRFFGSATGRLCRTGPG